MLERNESKYQMIKSQLSKFERMTANECIDSIFKNDLTAGLVNSVDRGWKFYVHLNKLFAPLRSAGHIKEVGTKLGPTGKTEKIWSVS